MKRTHHCNELRPAHVGKTVTLAGWVHSRRDLGGLIFIDVRDREGRTQTVFDPSDLPQELFDRAAALRSECVISVTGQVRHRPSGTSNPKIVTGEVEVAVSELEVLNYAEVLPFPVDDPEVASKVNEELRLQYRYLDLRRPEMARNLRLRHKAANATRVFLDEQGFLEVETPTLFKSTPEGAREFLVPSRLHPGQFYALPQSPQQFKQILMVAGIERYFQLARCYRDEDLRADRQPEFTQVDLEMSFIEREDIYGLIEGLLQRVWKTALNIDLPVPFKRISFHEALDRFGIDKPDTRLGMELADFTEAFRASNFKVFSGEATKPGHLYRIDLDGAVHQVSDGVLLTNGLGFSPDGRRLYHSDARADLIRVYEVEAGGALKPWTKFASLGPGQVADGLKVAVDGSVWVADAHGGRVAVLGADGRHLRDIPVPLPMVTSVCFGGDDLRDLYIVTGSRGGPRDNCGTVFRTRVDVAGLPLAPARVKPR